MLAEKGRVQLGTPPGDWIAGALRRSPVREAGLTHPIALPSRTVALPRADPADRFIAATAIALDLELLTADEILLASAVPTRSC